jgi:hypothetical protein
MRRRAGDKEATKNLYLKLVDLTTKSGDRTGSLQYFALNAYHSFLATDYTDTKNYDLLRAEIYSSWAVEELGKQPSRSEANLRAGGDWERLEKALKVLESQSILICRDFQPCHLWGESKPELLLASNEHSTQLAGLVYYWDPGPRNELDLQCSAPVYDALTKVLMDVGFKPTIEGSTYLRVTGKFGQK